MSAVCVWCGRTDADTWRFCSIKKEYICKTCELACPAYSSRMLPNGTNCRKIYERESYKKRILNRIFPASPKRISEETERFVKMDRAVLLDIYKDMIAKHDNSTDEIYRAELRPQLAAIQKILREAMT